MAEPAASYPFSSGDRLEDRNTYFYTPFGGHEFLDAWRAERTRLIATLPPAAESAPPAQSTALPAGEAVWQTAALCEHLFHGISEAGTTPDAATRALLDQLVRKFETTKRIHAAYQCTDFRPVDTEAYRDPAVYLRVAEIFEAGCASTGSLQCLNALLKIVDTLSGLAPALGKEGGSRLARLIAMELRHIETLAARLGVMV